MTTTTAEPEFLTRRRFLAALAASLVVAGLPLPIGMPAEVAIKTIKPAWREVVTMTFRIVFADDASEKKAREKMPELFRKSEAIEAA